MEYYSKSQIVDTFYQMLEMIKRNVRNVLKLNIVIHGPLSLIAS